MIETRINLFLFFVLLGSACTSVTEEVPLLAPLPKDVTGIEFNNDLTYTEELNPYVFKNFYNGGGVAVGDINNDGLPDIFFTGNLVENKLYLNRGELSFEDITQRAGVESGNVWSTGVSMIDINADGFLDIYVCKSGPPDRKKRYNELFINNGDLTFTERAGEYGLDNVGLSVQASFLDYDKDGDLDCYLLNNSIKSIGSFSMVKDQRLVPDTLGANKFYRNDNGHFRDITLESGIYSSEIGFGLGAMVGDVNNDNWPDLYISNDFYEKDYLYINKRDGTFEDQLEKYMNEISMGSMGADMADLNNDGQSEYFVTEMLPARRDRQVTKAFFDTWEGYKNAYDLGYFRQFGRNVLQLNNGDGTFSEIGRYAGVEATDWSWATLIFDLDNDGLKDIFVANGIYKDLLDLDYLRFMATPRMVQRKIQVEKEAIKSMIDMMPTEPIPNYIFKNNGDLTFTNKASEWGIADPTFSNGSAYGDLDNDGDLDLVVNNINMPSVIYENRTRQQYPERNYLSIDLMGLKGNTRAIGAKVKLFADNQVFYQEHNPIRGFESSVDYRLNFGLGSIEVVDSIKVLWPSDRVTLLKNVEVNQALEISEGSGVEYPERKSAGRATIFRPYKNSKLSFEHKENDYVDFHKDRLLFHMNSAEGPCLCKGDVNNDGKEDLYIGGASGQSGRLLLQQEDENFTIVEDIFNRDAESEEVDCVFLDANMDGNQDLYIATGGSEFGSISVWLKDRLYFGDGTGNFIKSKQRLPNRGYESSGVVVPWDFDKDGDLDLFVGGRSVPFFYGIPANSYLLENDGKGNFEAMKSGNTDILNRLGLVTDASTGDLDGDGNDELVVVGHWMPVKILRFSDGELSDDSKRWGTSLTNGWYNTVEVADLNRDGNLDLLVGNHGLNSRFKASKKDPIELLVGDLDDNGTPDQILSMVQEGVRYPFAQLKELAEQLPMIAQKYRSFGAYKYEPFEQVIPEKLQKKGQVLKTFNLTSGIFYNDGKKLNFKPLPFRAQLSPIFTFQIVDFNKDGYLDVLSAGNFAKSKPEVGSYLASFGDLFIGTAEGGFKYVPNSETGLYLRGSVRDSEILRIGENLILIFAKNDDKIFKVSY